jgi:hypothetical protein
MTSCRFRQVLHVLGRILQVESPFAALILPLQVRPSGAGVFRVFSFPLIILSSWEQ